MTPRRKSHPPLNTGRFRTGAGCRNFARWIGDCETAQQILALAEELKQRARYLARPNERRIQQRAHQIWEKMADQREETKGFGFRLNGNFGKLKISQTLGAFD